MSNPMVMGKVKPPVQRVYILMVNDFPVAVASSRAEARRLEKEEMTRMAAAMSNYARGIGEKLKLQARIWEFEMDKLDSSRKDSNAHRS